MPLAARSPLLDDPSPSPLLDDPDEIARVAAIVAAAWPDPAAGRRGQPTLSLGLQGSPILDLIADPPARMAALASDRRRALARPGAVLALAESAGAVQRLTDALTPWLPPISPADRLGRPDGEDASGRAPATPRGLATPRGEAGPAADGADPAAALARLAGASPVDLCLLTAPDDAAAEDVTPRLIAGAVGYPSRWRLADKLGRTLDRIHQPVPGLNARLDRPIHRLFRHLPVGRPVRRHNWLLTDDPCLAQPAARPVPALHRDAVADGLYVRTETQTLVRLTAGAEGVVAFLILVRQARLSAVVAKIAAARARLRAALAELSPGLTIYKGIDAHMPGLVGYCDGDGPVSRDAHATGNGRAGKGGTLPVSTAGAATDGSA